MAESVCRGDPEPVQPEDWQDFEEKNADWSITKYYKSNTFDDTCQYRLFLKVATRVTDNIVSGPSGNAKEWTFKRLRENTRCNADEVSGVKGSQPGTQRRPSCKSQPNHSPPEFTQKFQPRPPAVLPFPIGQKDIVEFGYAPGCRMTCVESEEWTRS